MCTQGRARTAYVTVTAQGDDHRSGYDDDIPEATKEKERKYIYNVHSYYSYDMGETQQQGKGRAASPNYPLFPEQA
jgi:hypothetical protein